MDTALQRAAQVSRIQGGPPLTLERDGFRYRIAGGTYTVTNGQGSLAAPIRWSFGHGKAGQTYVLDLDGTMYESRVSYYQSLRGLDLTLGAANARPATLRDALGRPMAATDVRECFGCHASHGEVARSYDLTRLVPGVTCERCHGPGSAHVQDLRTHRVKSSGIVNPGRATTEEMSDFCGQCHRTWADVTSLGIKGVNNVRFQPYRLTNSRCYDAADPRIRCVACHDPHQPVEVRAEAYDPRCGSCHRAGEQKLCRVAKTGCVTCHMPKTELPGTHFAFSDHRIRVVRPGAPYPD